MLITVVNFKSKLLMDDDDINLVKDIWWTFILPVICFCSLLANMYNVTVLNNLKNLITIYKLIYIKSLVNVINLFVCFWIFLSRCGQFCHMIIGHNNHSLSFIIQLYKFYLYGVLGRILGHCDLSIEVLIAIVRLGMLFRKRDCTTVTTLSRIGMSENKFVNWMIGFTFIISTLIYLPDVRFATIRRFDENISYSYTNYSQTVNTSRCCILEITELNRYVKTTIGVFIIVRTLLTLFLFLAINFVNGLQLRMKMGKIEKIRRENPDAVVYRRSIRLRQSSANFNRMLFYHSMLYLIANGFHYIAFLVFKLLNFEIQTPYFSFFMLATNTVLFTTFGLNTFIYLMFDERFRKESQAIFKDKSSTFN